MMLELSYGERLARPTREPADGEHDELDAVLRAQATRSVASLAHDAADAAMLLEMLGLDPAEGRR